MRTPINDDVAFVRSLNPAQRDYFHLREEQGRERLQAALRALGRGLGIVGQLQGGATAAALACRETKP